MSDAGQTNPLTRANFLGVPVIRVTVMRRSDPELLPIQRPRCSQCSARMFSESVEPGPEGFEHRTFRCLKCHHSEKRILVSDPFKVGAVSWLNGELGRGH